VKERLIRCNLAVGGSAWNDDGTEDPAGIFPGRIIADVRWNGWAIAAFTRTEVEKVVAYIGSDRSGDKATALYWEGDRLMLWEDAYSPGDEPYVEDVGPDEHGYFWPGAFSWTWTEMEKSL
jgi:hypothetical protein